MKKVLRVESEGPRLPSATLWTAGPSNFLQAVRRAGGELRRMGRAGPGPIPHPGEDLLFAEEFASFFSCETHKSRAEEESRAEELAEEKLFNQRVL